MPHRALPGLSIRGAPAWVDWVRDAAARDARSCSSLVEVALIGWARAEGVPDPPPRALVRGAETIRDREDPTIPQADLRMEQWGQSDKTSSEPSPGRDGSELVD